MKRISAWILGLSLVLLWTLPAWAGILTTNKFFYKPSLGARGTQEKSSFDSGLDRVDDRLGKEIWLGDPGGTPGYDTLAHAITTISTNNATLRIPAGTVAITTDTTIPANIALKVEKGATINIAQGVTLTINGILEAGPYQIFSGAGNVVISDLSLIQYGAWTGGSGVTISGLTVEGGAEWGSITGTLTNQTDLNNALALKLDTSALAIWTGSANLATLGTVTSGIWHGTAIGDAYISSAAAWNNKEPAIAAGTTSEYWRGDKSWQTLDSAAVGLGNVTNLAQITKALGTTKGDLIAFTASATPTRVGVGANGTYLKADSNAAEGVSWGMPTGAGDVVGPGVAVNSNFAAFDTTTGKLLKDSGKSTASFLAPNGNGSSLTGLTKTQVGLGSVENTALSTWTGSNTITTLGTLGTGTWQGTAIAPGYGGTGNAFTQFTGPTSSIKTFTLPDASKTLLATDGNGSSLTGLTKAQVGLANVENTAVSTWAGSSNLSTLGTIGTGIWHGTPIADAYIASAATWSAKLAPNGDGSSLTGLTKTQVGLANVTNVAQLPLSYLDTDPTLAANSDTRVASQKAVKAYADGISGGAGGWAGITGKPTITVGDTGYATLDAILADPAVTTGTIVVPAGTHTLNATTDRTLKAGLNLVVLKGGVIAVPTARIFTLTGNCEAGLSQTFSCTGTGKVVFGSGSIKQAHPEWWKASADTYWHAAIQQAIDACETAKIPIYFSQDMSVHGTLYVGNSPWISNGKTMTITSDTTFNQLGTGALHNEGAILTKSGASAGYGLSTVNVNISGLNIICNRTPGGTCIVTAVLLENCTGSINNNASIAAMSALDLYRSVQDFSVDRCTLSNMMVRNYSSVTPTRNIKITNSNFANDVGPDELLDIFVTYPNTIVENVIVSNCTFHLGGTYRNVCVTAAGIEPSATNGIVRNVKFSHCTIISTAPVRTVAFQKYVAGGSTENITADNIYIEVLTDTSYGVVTIVDGFDSLDNVYAKINGELSASNDVYFFNRISNMIKCENAFAGTMLHTNPIIMASCEQVDNCILRATTTGGRIYSVEKLLNSKIYNCNIIDCESVQKNNIYLSASVGNGVFLQQGISRTYPLARIEGNNIIETYAAQPWQWLFDSSYTASKMIIKNNYYNGSRRSFIYNTAVVLNAIEFTGNILDNGSTVINSDYCPTASNPWTLFGAQAAAFPIGHRVWKSDPAAASVMGWVKIGADGSDKTDWATMAIITAIP